eukprot:1380166-Amorphochlora_amoeboformis.AAC.2
MGYDPSKRRRSILKNTPTTASAASSVNRLPQPYSSLCTPGPSQKLPEFLLEAGILEVEIESKSAPGTRHQTVNLSLKEHHTAPKNLCRRVSFDERSLNPCHRRKSSLLRRLFDGPPKPQDA